jgi:hypothetical protein
MRHGMKKGYSYFTSRVMREMIMATADRSGRSMGNTLVISCNNRLLYQFADAMQKEHIQLGCVAGEGLVRADGKQLTLGRSYKGYHYQGNDVIFMPDDTLSKVYPDQGFGICLNTQTSEGDANIQLVTLQGRAMITGTLEGMGGDTGTKTDVRLATSVDGSEKHLLGYSGVALLNPYAAMIIREQVAS